MWLCLAAPTQAGETGWDFFAVRTGTDDTAPAVDFRLLDGHVTRSLPVLWASRSGWRVGLHVEAQGGVLFGGGLAALLGSAGPGLHVTAPARVLTLWLGISPTLLSRSRFGREDLGSLFHFTSHVGLGVGLGRHVTATYRFQHTSNADIWPVNPGLDMHIVGLGWRR